MLSRVLNQIVNLVILMNLMKLFWETAILDRFGFAYVKKILQKHVPCEKGMGVGGSFSMAHLTKKFVCWKPNAGLGKPYKKDNISSFVPLSCKWF